MKLLALLAPCAALASQLELELRANGSYALRLDGATWLESGATFFTAGGATFSTADGSLACFCVLDTSLASFEPL